MRKNCRQLLCFFIFLSCSLYASAVTDTLINTNASWKYRDNGSNQGTAWRATNFNDASWATGNAELGYGDGGEATVVSYGSSASNKYITTYFRKSFSVANPAIYSSLTLGILRDDGAVIYLNGTEVYRTNMPSGNINFQTKASSDITGTGETTFQYYTFTSPFLVAGTNNISVEIHQFAKTSPDISFNFNLSALQFSPCATPTGLTTTNITTNSATLNWAAISGAVGYNVEYRIVGNPSWSTATSATNSVNISSLTPSANYEWHVQTNCGSSNLSAFSSLSNFTTLTPPCNAPAGLSATNVTTNSATLNWNSVSGAIGYNVEYRVIGNPTWSTTTAATNSANISSLTPSANYEWHVQTNCGSSNLSGFSAISNFTTLTPCGVPSGLSTTNIATNSATLNWNAVSGAISYNVEYRVVGNPSWSTTTSATNSANISSLTPASNYEWHVQANCGSSNLSAFSAISNFATLTPPCGVPAGLSTTNITTSSATLNWNAVSGAVSYNIEYRVVGNPSWSTTTSATNSVNISSLTISSNYEWHVQANCGNSNLSSFSVISNFTTSSVPCNIPTGTATQSISETFAVLRWNPVTGAVSYNVRYRPLSSSTWTTTNIAHPYFNYNFLSAATQYEWQVQTVCSSGTSAFTASAVFKTPLNSPNTNIITSGSSWKYLDKGFEMSGWKGLLLDESQWGTGPSELGYGDNDEATVVSYGTNSSLKYITTYFRKTVNISNPAQYNTMVLDVVRDDGIIVYVNGTEVCRNNMPAGTATYNTFASSAISLADESDWRTTSFLPSLLVNGLNIFAVEIHQNNQTSSDISFNLKLTGCDTVPQITRGPYLQMMTQNSVVVRWRTNFPSESRIRYGLNPSDYDMMAYDPVATTEHAVTITGLQNDLRYYYTIETGNYFIAGDTTYQFLTQPVNAPGSSIQIWAFGDFGNGSPEQLAVRNAFRNDTSYNKTNLFLWLGDNAYEEGTDNQFQQSVFDVYGQELRRFALFPTIGNHEYANVGYQSSSALGTGFPYFSVVTVPTAGQSGGVPSGTEKYYSFNYYGVHFISLDMYGALNNSTSAMYTWLQNDLNQNAQRWTIVYFHHPPYTMGSHNSDTEAELINARQNIIPLLESYHVDLVLNGHSHVNERSFLLKGHYGLASSFNSSMIIQGGSGAPSAPYVKNPPYDGTVYATCGTGGKISSTVQSGWPMPCMYFSNHTQNASLVINVSWEQLDCRYLGSNGVNIDQFRIIKSLTRQDATAAGMDNALNIYPNPFTGETTISYALSEDGFTELNLYNLDGKEIHSFTGGQLFQCAGNHEFKLSPSALSIAQGIYFVRLVAGENVSVQKVVFVKE